MPTLREIQLPITGMTCTNCSATVERTLRKTEGVEDASVNYASERATVRFGIHTHRPAGDDCQPALGQQRGQATGLPAPVGRAASGPDDRQGHVVLRP